MIKLAGLFELFEEQDKYQSYLPAVVFAYIYYLSSESVFILLAVVFTINATFIIESKLISERMYKAAENKDILTPEQKVDIYRSQGLEIFKELLSIINATGYLAAAAVCWNNVVGQDLMIRSPPELSESTFIKVLLNDYVSTSEILLLALLFLVLLVIIRVLANPLVRIIYLKGL